MIDAYNVIGYMGVFFYISSYLLLQLNIIKANALYTFLNLIAPMFVLVSLYKYNNTPSVVIQLVWITVSLVGLYVIYKNRDKNFEYFLSSCVETKRPTHLLVLLNNKLFDSVKFENIKWENFSKVNIQNGIYITAIKDVNLYKAPPLRNELDMVFKESYFVNSNTNKVPK